MFRTAATRELGWKELLVSSGQAGMASTMGVSQGGVGSRPLNSTQEHFPEVDGL